jgi:hypothetical protein
MVGKCDNNVESLKRKISEAIPCYNNILFMLLYGNETLLKLLMNYAQTRIEKRKIFHHERKTKFNQHKRQTRNSEKNSLLYFRFASLHYIIRWKGFFYIYIKKHNWELYLTDIFLCDTCNTSHGGTASHAHRITSRDDDDVFLSHHNNEQKSYFRLQPSRHILSYSTTSLSLHVMWKITQILVMMSLLFVLGVWGVRKSRIQGEIFYGAIIIIFKQCSFVHFHNFTLTSSGFIFHFSLSRTVAAICLTILFAQLNTFWF